MTVLTGIAGDILDRMEAETAASYEPRTNKRTYTKSAGLTFARSELLYDIENLAYVEGDVMPAKDEHERHQVMDIAQVGNVDRVTRMIDLAMARAVELLYPYSKRVTDEEESRDDTLTETTTYTMELMLPDDFAKSTVTLIEKLVHEYIVMCVLHDWMGIANVNNREAVTHYEDKMKSAEEEIKSTLHARTGRVRRTQTPF